MSNPLRNSPLFGRRFFSDHLRFEVCQDQPAAFPAKIEVPTRGANSDRTVVICPRALSSTAQTFEFYRLPRSHASPHDLHRSRGKRRKFRRIQPPAADCFVDLRTEPVGPFTPAMDAFGLPPVNLCEIAGWTGDLGHSRIHTSPFKKEKRTLI